MRADVHVHDTLGLVQTNAADIAELAQEGRDLDLLGDAANGNIRRHPGRVQAVLRAADIGVVGRATEPARDLDGLAEVLTQRFENLLAQFDHVPKRRAGRLLGVFWINELVEREVLGQLGHQCLPI